MKALLFLMVAHYLGDYPYQGDFLASFKGRFKYILFCHAFIWTGCVAVPREHLGLFAWWKIGFLLIGHLAIDYWKVTHKDAAERGLTSLLWIDQTLHALQVVVVWGI